MQVLTNAGLILKTDPQVLYVSPVDTTSAVHTIFFTTINEDISSFISIDVYDASEGKLYKVAKDIEVVPKATFSFDRPIYLDQNDEIRVYANENNKVHCFASIMKIIPLSL